MAAAINCLEASRGNPLNVVETLETSFHATHIQIVPAGSDVNIYEAVKHPTPTGPLRISVDYTHVESKP